MAHKKPTSRAHRTLLSRRRTAVRVIELRPDAESVGYVGSQPHTHGGTCGDNLNTTLILHPDLFNITRMPRGETVKELGSNMASFSNLTGVFSAPREITAFENHEPRHLRSLMYGDNLYRAQQSRQIQSFTLPILLNKDYSDGRMWSFTAHTPPIHFMLNNYNDCIKGDTKYGLETNVLHKCPIGSTIISLGSSILEVDPHNWHEKVFILDLPGKEMPFERPISNPEQEMKLLIFKYTKKDHPQFAGSNKRRPRRHEFSIPTPIKLEYTLN